MTLSHAPPTSELDIAIELARWMHRNQVDKSGKPYCQHLFRVAMMVGDEAKAAALLHDVVEDQPITDGMLYRIFSDDTAHAVHLLTRDPARQTFFTYIRLIKGSPGKAGEIAREVKIADLRDNLSDARRFDGDGSLRKRHIKALKILGESWD